MKEEEKFSKMNYTVSFNRRLSVAEKLRFIKYAEENIIHVASNYYEVSKTRVRYWIKKRKN